MISSGGAGFHFFLTSPLLGWTGLKPSSFGSPNGRALAFMFGTTVRTGGSGGGVGSGGWWENEKMGDDWKK